MAGSNGKISGFPQASSLSGSETIEIIQDGVNKQVALSLIGLGGGNGGGQSAYDIAVAIGYVGTKVQWVASLKGDKGDTGATGPQGPAGVGTIGLTGPAGPAGAQGATGPAGATGAQGLAGATGPAGTSAYQSAVNAGFVGTEAAWVISLKGLKGDQGNVGPSGSIGPQGLTGAAGQSAYQLAVTAGFSGDVTAWLASLKGATGNTGAAGTAGQSAYQLAVSQGYSGTLTQWLASLIGVPGAQGIKGDTGATGATGPQGSVAASENAFLIYLASHVDHLFVGTVTLDSNGAATAANVTWPDGATGVYNATTVSTAFPGKVDAYTVTHVLGGVTKTVTQTAVTRNASGIVSIIPARTVA